MISASGCDGCVSDRLPVPQYMGLVGRYVYEWRNDKPWYEKIQFLS